jgi:transposase-like protein
MKAKGAGDVWTWTALDAETKLIPCWFVGQRDAGYACHFIHDLRARLANRVQLTTDGRRAYLTAVEDAFGAEINYAMLQKIYGTTRSTIDQKSEIRGQDVSVSAFPFNVLR